MPSKDAVAEMDLLYARRFAEWNELRARRPSFILSLVHPALYRALHTEHLLEQSRMFARWVEEDLNAEY